MVQKGPHPDVIVDIDKSTNIPGDSPYLPSFKAPVTEISAGSEVPCGISGLMRCNHATQNVIRPRSSVGSLDLVSRLLFPTPASSYTVEDFPGELIWVPKSMNPQTCSPEECIPCLFLTSPSARFTVLYLHSNAEDLGQCYSFCCLLRHQFQVHVLAVEYPGYGLCPGGQADEDSVIENVFSAFRFLREVICWPLDGILILGRSIGTGPALALAAANDVYGVILVSPFLSVQEVVKGLVGPLGYLIADRFPNKERVPKLQSPLLVVHGKLDVVVPVEHGQKLYESCKSRKRLVCPDTMHHNSNLYSDPNYFVLPMLQFFALPDFCFEDPCVPFWAYDKRLCVHYVPGIPVQPKWCSLKRENDENSNLVVVGVPVMKRFDHTPNNVTPSEPAFSPRISPPPNKPDVTDDAAPKPLDILSDEGPAQDSGSLPPSIEDATSEAVARYLSRKCAVPAQECSASSTQAPDEHSEEEREETTAPLENLFAKAPEQDLVPEEDLPDLPEPAFEGMFSKVPHSKTCPVMSAKDKVAVVPSTLPREAEPALLISI